MRLQVGDPVALKRRDHERGRERHLRIEIARQLQQPLLLHPIDLVECEQHRRRRALEPAQDALDILVDALGRIDHQQHLVRVVRPAPRRIHHRPVEAAARLERCPACR